MANKSLQKDRKAVINDIRKKQGRAENVRGAAIVGVCVVIALGIVGAAAWNPITSSIKANKYNDVALQDIGKSAKAAACAAPTTVKADGNQQHIATGTQQVYTTAPPAFGPHWNEQGVAPVDMGRKFYTAADRPDLEALVHNLEHGYTIVWYDDKISKDDRSVLESIGKKFKGTTDFRDKFIAVPWTAKDAKETFKKGDAKTAFPAGKHVAITHWSAGGNGQTDTTKQVGAFEYCGGVSGQAIKDFMLKYPYTDSPEPGAM